MDELAQLLAVSAVVTGLSHTLTKERIFAPLRERLGGMKTWFGYLVSCPYCASHYIAFVLVPLTGTYAVRVPHDWGLVADLLSWFLSSILVTFVAAFFRIVFYFVDEKQSLTRSEKELVRQEAHPESLPETNANLPAAALHSYERDERVQRQRLSGQHAGHAPGSHSHYGGAHRLR